MALSLNPATKVITIPKADLAPVTGTLYALDTDAFRLEVNALLSSEPYIWLDDAYTHNTTVTVAGTTFARTIEFINGFSVEFDDSSGTDPYSVRLEGSNNNIFDIQNGILVQNLVQVIPTNSAGLIQVEGGAGNTPQEIASAVWEALVADYINNPTTQMGAYLLGQLEKIDTLISDFTPLLGLVTVDYASFIAAFPEFDQIDQTYIETKIGEASAMLDVLAFGDVLHNIAVLYRTAHLLAISPYGKQMQLVSDDGKTTYGQAYNELLEPLVGRRGMLL